MCSSETCSHLFNSEQQNWVKTLLEQFSPSRSPLTTERVQRDEESVQISKNGGKNCLLLIQSVRNDSLRGREALPFKNVLRGCSEFVSFKLHPGFVFFSPAVVEAAQTHWATVVKEEETVLCSHCFHHSWAINSDEDASENKHLCWRCLILSRGGDVCVCCVVCCGWKQRGSVSLRGLMSLLRLSSVCSSISTWMR